MNKNGEEKINQPESETRFQFSTQNLVVILSVLAASLYLPLLGNYPLLGEWEAFFGRAAMEMMTSNSWDWFLDPLYLGKYDLWSKPVLCYWMVFPFMKILGPTEFALRLPFALNGIAFVILVFYITKKLLNDNGRAFFAAFITIFTPFTFLITRHFMWDITLVTFITGATGFLYIGWRDNNRKLLRLAYLFMGLGMLTKGLIALFVPAIIFIIFFIVITDYSKGAKNSFVKLLGFFKEVRAVEGLIIVLAVSGWWFLYMGIKHGTPFFNEFFGKHHFSLLAGKLNKPDGPFEFYVW
ncbi:MAG TPA: phospholipid carrier-dependent glycosyltransferase, partial [bacterium]|nr:phospholipid carrier-dependent glycosyltransferase [bacterium]